MIDELLAGEHDNYASYLRMPGLAEDIKTGLAAGGIDLPDGQTAEQAGEMTLRKVIASGVVDDRLTVLQWKKLRIVYRIDNDLASALAQTDHAAMLPSDVFTRLPHPDPLVLFDTPLVLDPATGDALLGFFVTGRDEDQRVVSSHSAASACLSIALCTLQKGKRGVGGGFSMGTQDGQTVSDLIASLSSTYEAIPKSEEIEGQRASLPPLGCTHLAVPFVVSVLTYLCSEAPDVQPRPGAVPTQRGSGGKSNKTPRIWDVGWRVGAALRAYHAGSASENGRGTPVRPHIRRAHWHTYRVGPGRAQSVIKWISPILVGVRDVGLDALPGVVVDVKLSDEAERTC
ncbi:hypothetical protein BG844_19650 [Couchioplanes caeruleus subsp. caeruleus]|uniref:Uncharacterized protein n=1 Tax=Couchioplanes caeruleus subsp. caeruleus TaxID=56427 RepID=A0A1K0FIF8_9ACTN|nr:hypothetical protein BG844_19650 [Couchioplanes caeruleus subsp. caeruleus]